LIIIGPGQLFTQIAFTGAMSFRSEPVFTEIFCNEVFIERITHQGNGHGHHPDQNDQGKIYNRAVMDRLIHIRGKYMP
jgi:hypothetical protein